MLRMINNALVMAARELTGKQPSPTAGVIDSQSVKNHGKWRNTGL